MLKKYGRITVLHFSHKDAHYLKYYKCKCDCGKIVVVRLSDLKSKNTASCGCLNREISSKKHKTHGLSKSKIYNIWKLMKHRCTKGWPDRKLYYDRNIKVCKRWNNFKNFLKDMGVPELGQTIDRIDNNKGYSKNNCRWTSWAIQNRNKRSNKMITFEKQTLCMVDWAKIKNINPGTLGSRFRSNWSIEKALNTPVNQKNYINGK